MGFKGPSTSGAGETQAAKGIRVETSAYGGVVPLVFGETRLAGNIIWIDGFKSHESRQATGGKEGGRIANTQFTYTCHVFIAICEGVLENNFEYVDIGPAVVGASSLNQADGRVFEPGVWTTKRVKFAGKAEEQSDGGGLIKRFAGFNSYEVPDGPYVGQSRIVVPVLADGAPSALLQASFGSFTIPPVNYFGTAVVAARNLDLGSNASIPQFNWPIRGLCQYYQRYGIPPVGIVVDANPCDIAVSLLVDVKHGIDFRLPTDPPGTSSLIPFYLTGPNSWGHYTRAADLLISPGYDAQRSMAEVLDELAAISNAAVVWSDGLLKVIPYGDAPIYSGRLGALYDPTSTTDPHGTDLTVHADLTADDFLREGSDQDLVTVTSRPLAEVWNHIRVEYLNRANAYAVDIQEAKDEAHIAGYGLRSRQPYKYSGITSSTVARLVAQNHLAREMGARTLYRFTVGWRFVLLEPMDLITLTDLELGLDHQPARITSITESESGNITIEAEEYTGGVGVSESYQHQGPEAPSIDYDVSPGPIFDLVMFEPQWPLARQPELWLGASGLADRWGGASVYVSENEDGEYEYVATMGRGIVHGSMMQALLAMPSPDTTSSPLLRLGQEQTLPSGTTADAEALRRLLYIGNGNRYEIVSYSTATLVSVSDGYRVYEIGGYLVRGAYSSVPLTHGAGARVMRLDEQVVKIPLPMRLVGKRLFVKLVPVNVFGSVSDDVTDVSTHYFDVEGTWFLTPLANVEGLHVTLVDGYATLGWSSMIDTRGSVMFEVRSGDTWATGTVIGRTPTTSMPVRGAGTYWVAAYLELATGRGVRTVYSETPDSVLVSEATATTDFFREIGMEGADWVGSAHPYVAAVMSRSAQTYLRFTDRDNMVRDFAGRGAFEAQVTNAVQYAGNGLLAPMGGELEGAAYFNAVVTPAAGVTLLAGNPASAALRYFHRWSLSFRFRRDRQNVAGGECLIDASLNTQPLANGTTGWRLCIEQDGSLSIDNGRNQVLLGQSAVVVDDQAAHTCVLTYESDVLHPPPALSYPLPFGAGLGAGAGVYAIFRVILDGVEVLSVLPANMIWPGISPLFGCRANSTGGSRNNFRGYMSDHAWHDVLLTTDDGAALHAAAEDAPVGGLVVDRANGVVRLAGLAVFEDLVGDVDDLPSIDAAGGLASEGAFYADGSQAAQVLTSRTTVRPYAEIDAGPQGDGGLMFDELGGLVDELAPLEGADPAAVTALVEYAPARVTFAEHEYSAANVTFARQAMYEAYRPFLPGLQEAVALRWRMRLKRNEPYVGVECRRLLVGADALERTESQQSVAVGAGVERFLASGRKQAETSPLELALPVDVPAGRSLILAVAYGTGEAADVVATINGTPFVELVAAGGSNHYLLGDPRVALLQFGVASPLDAGTIVVVDVPAEPANLLAASLFSIVGAVTADRSATIADAKAADGVVTVGPTPALSQALELAICAFGVRTLGTFEYTPTGVGLEFIQAGTAYSNGAFDVLVCGHVRTTQATTGVTMAGQVNVPMGQAPWYAGVIRTFLATATAQRILFRRPFNGAPSVQVTVLDMQAGDTVRVLNVDNNGFDVQVENAAVIVPRQISWVATGD